MVAIKHLGSTNGENGKVRVQEGKIGQMCRRQASKDAVSRRGNQGWWLVDWTGPLYGALSGCLVVALVIYVALDQVSCVKVVQCLQANIYTDCVPS